MEAVTGSCLCGEVVFEVRRFGEHMYHCHCGMCRKHHGSAFGTYVTAAPADVVYRSGEERIGRYESSPGGFRTFCSRCGSSLPTTDAGGLQAAVPPGLLDADCGLRPAAHVFANDKAGWYEIADGLPEFTPLPEGFDFRGYDRPRRGAAGDRLGGSCLCGAVAFEIDREPDGMMNCFCRRCQKSRSAAHATNLFIVREHFRFLGGEDRIATFKVPEAERFTAAFCSDCGSQVPALWPGWGSALIPAGAMDDDFESRPIGNIFVADKAPWYQIPNDLEQWPQGRPGR